MSTITITVVEGPVRQYAKVQTSDSNRAEFTSRESGIAQWLALGETYPCIKRTQKPGYFSARFDLAHPLPRGIMASVETQEEDAPVERVWGVSRGDTEYCRVMDNGQDIGKVVASTRDEAMVEAHKTYGHLDIHLAGFWVYPL